MAAVQRPALPLPRTGQLARTLGRWFTGGRRWWIIALVLLLAAAVLQVNQFSRVTSTGYDIDALRRLHAARQAQNNELKAEVAQLSALARIDWAARTRLGMEPATQRVYITVNHPLPERAPIPERFRSSTAIQQPQDDASSSFWRRLAGWLTPFR
jgi:cell division protein FtsL